MQGAMLEGRGVYFSQPRLIRGMRLVLELKGLRESIISTAFPLRDSNQQSQEAGPEGWSEWCVASSS